MTEARAIRASAGYPRQKALAIRSSCNRWLSSLSSGACSFSYRRRNRERPQIGDHRPPSPLGDIQPAGWPAEYTAELLNVLNVLGRLVALEPAQADLLQRICAAPTLNEEALWPD